MLHLRTSRQEIFPLTISNAILRYICEAYQTDENYYSNSIQRRSKVNSALDWSLFVLRKQARDIISSITLQRPQLSDDYWGTNTGTET